MDASGALRFAANGPATGHTLERLRVELKRAATQHERMELLAATQRAEPWVEQELERALCAVPEERVMFDDVLKLIKVWRLHRDGQQADRDYYISAFECPEQRSEIRDCLGISPRRRAEVLVLLVTVDCLRGDRLSSNGYPRPTTPAMDALAAEGVNFGRAYSTAGQTAQSFPGIFLSNYFQDFGRSRCIPDHLASLPEVMSANGYYTVAYNAANPHVSHFYGYDRGFDEFYDFLAPENFRHSSETFADDSYKRLSAPSERELVAIFEELQARPDIYATVKALTGLDGLPLMCHIAQRRRFYPYDAADLVKGAIGTLLAGRDRRKQFYWLHFMDLHENITVPFSRLGGFSAVEQFLLNTCLASPMGQQVLRGNAEKYGQLYDSAVSYVDMNVEILRNFLADHGLLESSLICLTADHGQELLERGVFGHGYDRLAEGVVHVPLVFGGGLAGGIDGSHSDRAVSTLDIAPTILDVCGITDAPDTFLGSSLNDVRPRPIYGQTFYGGADNRCTTQQGRSFELKPFPAPVRECCQQMVYCIQGDYQVIYDAAERKTEVHRLRSSRRSGATVEEPNAERLKDEAEAYFRGVYQPPRSEHAYELTEEGKATVAHRLQDLGYL